MSLTNINRQSCQNYTCWSWATFSRQQIQRLDKYQSECLVSSTGNMGFRMKNSNASLFLSRKFTVNERVHTRACVRRGSRAWNTTSTPLAGGLLGFLALLQPRASTGQYTPPTGCWLLLMLQSTGASQQREELSVGPANPLSGPRVPRCDMTNGGGIRDYKRLDVRPSQGTPLRLAPSLPRCSQAA